MRHTAGPWLLFGAIALFIAALFFDPNYGSNSSSSKYADGSKKLKPKTLEQIDQELKKGLKKIEISATQAELDNNQAPPVPEEAYVPGREGGGVNPLQFDQENPGQRVQMDTEQRQQKRGTPDQRISSKVERDAWIRDYEKRQKATYVREFIENARRNGVDVQLNENLDVVGLQRFDVEKPLRFPQSQGAKSSSEDDDSDQQEN
jgi:hypothetical protein